MRALRLSVAGVTTALCVSGCAVGIAGPATGISPTGVTVNGYVYSTTGGDTDYWVRFGNTTAYDHQTPHQTVAVTEDHPETVSLPLTGLDPDSTYHYRLCAQDTDPRTGPVCSLDETLGTIGDTVRGAVDVNGSPGSPFDVAEVLTFDVASGPAGENAGGEVGIIPRIGSVQSYGVTCLRVAGPNRFTIGSEAGVWYLNAGTIVAETAALPSGACPADPISPSIGSPYASNHLAPLMIHDAP